MTETKEQFKLRIARGFQTFNEPGENFLRATDLILIPTSVFLIVMGYSLLQSQPDLGLILIYFTSISLFSIFNMFILLAAFFPLRALASFLGGWFLAGVWLRLRYGKKAQSLLVDTAKAIFVFLVIVLGLSFFPFLFVLGTVTFFFLLILFGLVLLQMSTGFMILMLPAYFGTMIPFESYFGKNIESSQTKPAQYRNFLMLTGPIPPTANEQVQHCPFKNKVQNTCTYLSYPTIDLPQICDYKSTYTRCYVFRKLVKKVEEIQQEVNEK